jgi:predicted enzyme related to lactoylglutathione lyase
MPLINSHAPGSFCWIELGTTDQVAAKSFYGDLFGWKADDVPMGPTDFYTMFQLEGMAAAAAYSLRPETREKGVGPHWMLYVAVKDADSSAAQAGKLGGTIIEQPFDVFDVGRMALIADPTGAVFSIWQSKRHKGTGITGVEGTLCWADLSTPDPAQGAVFAIFEKLESA